MNTKDIAAEYRMAHWAQIIRERVESGLSIRAFCKKAEIRENTYYYWQKKLREVACEQLSMVQINSTQTNLVRPGFAEVKLRDSLSQITHNEPELQGNLFMEISGVKMTADSAYPIGQIASLLRELMKQC
jgi:transposase-like protein